MQFIPVPVEVFARALIDVVQENKLIITATDDVSKWVETHAVRKADTPTLAKFLVECIICRHAIPQILQSDNRSIFTSDFFEQVAK